MYHLKKEVIGRILDSIEADLVARQFKTLKYHTTPVEISKRFNLIAADFESDEAYTPNGWNLYPDCIPPKRGFYMVDFVVVYERVRVEEYSAWKVLCEWNGMFLMPYGTGHDVLSDRKAKKFFADVEKEKNETGTYGPEFDVRVEVRYRSFYDGLKEIDDCDLMR